MTEYDYWKIFPRMPKKVTLGDITIRDGFQHLEKFISTRAKIFFAENMIFAGCRNIEVTNLGNAYLMPQFSDAEQVCLGAPAQRPVQVPLRKKGNRLQRSDHHRRDHPRARRGPGH